MPEIRIDPLSGGRTVLTTPGEPAAYAARQLLQALPAGVRAESLPADPEAWRERMRAHGGAAALHVHATREGAQLLAFDFVPAALARERERFSAYAAANYGANLLGDLVQEEVKLGERLVAVDDEAVLLVPFAAPAAYALLVAPRTPRARFEDDGPLGAALLADGLRRLDAVADAPAYDLWVRTAPRGADHFCWRIDVVPRAAEPTRSGTGVAVVGVAPEAAAAALREA